MRNEADFVPYLSIKTNNFLIFAQSAENMILRPVKANRLFIKSLFFLILIFSFTNGMAQRKDSVATKNVERMLISNEAREISKPAKAALMSAVLPGLGQAYNRKYWKIPLVYGGAVAFGAVIRFNHNQYTDFRNALINEIDDDPTTVNQAPFNQFQEASLRSVRDQARRNRDYSIILATVFYGLNILDATVDAHLSDFDVSDDISLRLSPTLLPTLDNRPMIGLSLRASF